MFLLASHDQTPLALVQRGKLGKVAGVIVLISLSSGVWIGGRDESGRWCIEIPHSVSKDLQKFSLICNSSRSSPIFFIPKQCVFRSEICRKAGYFYSMSFVVHLICRRRLQYWIFSPQIQWLAILKIFMQIIPHTVTFSVSHRLIDGLLYVNEMIANRFCRHFFNS